MGPEKRATCKDVVEKFRLIHAKASVDEDYCLQAAPGQPKRINTDLSTLSQHFFETTEYVRSNPEHHGIQEDQSKSRPVPGAAQDRIVTDEHTNRSISRTEESDTRQRTLGVPSSRDSRGKTRLDHSPSTNRSSSRSTNAAGIKLPLPREAENERDEKRRGLRRRFRSLLCW